MAMDDRQLIEILLSRLESEDLDFKSRPYNLSNRYLQAKFIKDIVAMANTPRSDSAYILLGVTEYSGKATGVPGVESHPDEAEFVEYPLGEGGSGAQIHVSSSVVR